MTGFNLQLEREHSEDTDYVGGISAQPCIALIPEDKRLTYLPTGELQNIGFEKMDCASRAPINYLESKFTWLYQNKLLSLKEVNFFINNGYVNGGRIEFSDAYIAIKSGTTKQGNSLKAPCQAIHEWGLIPKSLMPQMMTFEDHHDPARITPEIEALGKKFLELFIINYDKNYEIDYSKDFYVIAGFAWSTPVNGVYPRVDFTPNHAFLGVKSPKHLIFDNYDEDPGPNEDFTKQLAPDYALLDYSYRLYISRPVQVKKNPFWDFWKRYWQEIMK